jgi:hypothetical protein
VTIETKTEDQETQSDIDLNAAQAEISSELFGQGDDGEEGDASKEALTAGEGEASSGDDAAVAPPQADAETKVVEGEVVEENSDAVQETGAPTTWTKEALETWATIPPRAQQEILKREQDFFNGINQYKEAANLGLAYDKVVEPYRPMLAAENIDPVGLFQSFSANHYMLSRGTPEQKVQVAAQLINGYGIPLGDLLNYIAESDEPVTVDPRLDALQKEIAELKSTVTTRTTHEHQAAAQRTAAEVDAFAADPAHPYFDEVAGQIHNLFKAGVANTLAEAYEMAVYANPVTRQKEIDRLTAERTSAAKAEEDKRKEKVARLTGDHVRSSSKSRDGTVPKGSIDDTLRETMAAISERGD